MEGFDSADRSASTLTAGENARTNSRTGEALRMKTKVAYSANFGPELFQMIHFVSSLPKKSSSPMHHLKNERPHLNRSSRNCQEAAAADGNRED